MPKKPAAPGVLHYTDDGTWTGYASYNAGDPNGAGTGNLVPLAGYAQTDTNYVGTLSGGNVLEMGNGHKALFLDDSISPGYDGGARLVNIDTIKLGSTGDQLLDLTSNQYSLNVSTIIGGKGNEIILNNDGNTTIHTGSGNDYVWTGSGNNTVIGGAGNDTIVTGNGNNKLYGGSGDNVFVLGNGNNLVDGGGGTHNPNATHHTAGHNTADFTRVNGYLTVDIGDHTATVTDPVTGAVTANDTLVSIDKVIGNNTGMYVDTGNKSGITVVGGTGNDIVHIEGVNETLSGGGGDNIYNWTRKFVAAQVTTGGATEITDFNVGQDQLDLSDFLKGQGIKHAQYSDVVQVQDTAQGELVSVLANGQWHQLALLDNVHGATVDSLVAQHTVPPFHVPLAG